MLEISSLSVSAGETVILSSVSLDFEKGKVYAIAWKNGSGKSSFALALMGHPRYKIQSGEIILDGINITNLSPTERAHKGIFLSLQNIPEIPGVRLSEYLRTIYNEHQKRLNNEFKTLTPFVFRRFLAPLREKLSIPEAFLDRDLNVGFSGWEKRRIEMLQIELLSPKYIILDEIDSGLDIDAFRMIAASLKQLSSPENTFIIITHNFGLFEYLVPDQIFVLDAWKVIKTWDISLISEIQEQGFQS